MATKGGFEGDIEYSAAELKAVAGLSRDIAKSINAANNGFAAFAKKADEAKKKMSDLASQMERMNQLGNKNGFNKLASDFKKANHKMLGFTALDKIVKGIDDAFDSLAALGGSVIKETFNFLVGSIKRVYELQERWTKAIGGFNMKMGGMTAGMKGAQKAATQWSSTIRGLTNGDIFEGIQMFEEYTFAMSRVVEKGDDFSKFGLQLARGFNLGGQGAGKLARTFEDMTLTANDGRKVMAELADAANIVGVPVNQLASDVADANTYMARFGKEGAKGFVTAAGYARKFAMSMKELQAATERFDMFDESATMASKLNSTFGTLINSIDLTLMDDPAQRMEYIRQQMIAQGRTYEAMSVGERRLAAETMQVNEQQLASLLNLTNANTSYADMKAKQEAKERSEVEAKKVMEVQLRKTAQTMYAFGAAFDRITVAIAKAIKPLLVVFGLAKSGGKDFSSFGKIMEAVTKHIEYFFNSLAANPDWNRFMIKLANGVKELAKGIGNFITSGKAADWAGRLADALSDVYDFAKSAFGVMLEFAKKLEGPLKFVASHIKEIVYAWGAWQSVKGAVGVYTGMKGALGGGKPQWDNSAVRGSSGGGVYGGAAHVAAGGISDMFGDVDGGNDRVMSWDPNNKNVPLGFNKEKLSLRQRMGAHFRRNAQGLKSLKVAGGMGAAGAMAGIGTIMAGGSAGEGIGAGVGSAGGTAIGMILGGPLGAAVGGAIGNFVGTKLGGAIGKLFKPGESALDKARKQLASVMDEASNKMKRYSSITEILNDRLQIQDATRMASTSKLEQIEEKARKSKGKVNQLSEEEKSVIQNKIKDLKDMGMSSKALEAILDKTNKKSELTDKELSVVLERYRDYETKLANINDAIKQETELRMMQVRSGLAAQEKKRLEIDIKEKELTLSDLKGEKEKIKKGQGYAQIDEYDPTAKTGIHAEFAKFVEGEAKKGGVLGGKPELYSKEALRGLSKQFALQKKEKEIQDAEMQIVAGKEKATKLGIELDKKLFLLETRQLLMMDDGFKKFAASSTLSRDAAFEKYMKNSPEMEANRKMIGKDLDALFDPKAMASGGVVNSPTRALIGENGPEAVIPLKAIARGARITGSGAIASNAAANLASIAGAKTGSGKQSLQVVTSDIILDSTKVGRALTYVALTSQD